MRVFLDRAADHVGLAQAGPGDAERLGALSRAGKESYRAFAPVSWHPPSYGAERHRWLTRLNDPAGWTAVAVTCDVEEHQPAGVIHFSCARTNRGRGACIAGRAHLAGLFVAAARRGRGAGTTLLAWAVAEMRRRSYLTVELCTAIGNRRSRSFYEARGWNRIGCDSALLHDGLQIVAYERNLVRRL